MKAICRLIAVVAIAGLSQPALSQAPAPSAGPTGKCGHFDTMTPDQLQLTMKLRNAMQLEDWPEADRMLRAIGPIDEPYTIYNRALLVLNDMVAPGTASDYVASAQAMLRVARYGCPPAMTMAAVLYNAGRGVPQDFPSAVMWATLAVAGMGSDERTIQVRDAIVAQHPEAVAEGQRMARGYRPTDW